MIPTQFPLTGEESLRVIGYNSLTGVNLFIQGRYFDETGVYRWFQYRLTPTTDRQPTSKDFKLPRGVLSNLIVFVQGAVSLVGQTFAIVQIVVGDTGATFVMGTILQGYVTQQSHLGWPGSPIQSSLDSGGYLHSFQGTNPAPGNAVHETCPTNARWELLGVFLNFVTSAVVGNRQPILSTSPDGFGINTVCPATNLYPPSTSRPMSWQPGVNAVLSATGQQQLEPLPVGLQIGAGGFLDIDANGKDTADDFTGPFLTVREWIIP